MIGPWDSYIENRSTGQTMPMCRRNGVFVMQLKALPSTHATRYGEVLRTEDEFGFQEAGVNQNVAEMRECTKTKREIGARTEGCVAKIEGVGDVRREELEEWESMTKRRSSLLSSKKRVCNCIHAEQHSLFPERLRFAVSRRRDIIRL